MHLEYYYELMLPAVETILQERVNMNVEENLTELLRMLRYHLGWEGEGAGEKAQGKRIRPMLALLTVEASGGDWEKALPAAAAVELVHNFSLIHDDIQDNSELRRGRPTVWTKWGTSQAINAGDSLFSLAHLSMQNLENSIPLDRQIRASNVLRKACLILTQGQFLDLAYEQRGGLSIDSYWPMIQWKTASLLSACTELGAIISEVDENRVLAFKEFGMRLGLAFQVHDDFLGIWGDAAQTGKSSESDLLTGKKSLPILFAFQHGGDFARLWGNGKLSDGKVAQLVEMMELAGAKDYTIEKVNQLTEEALAALENAKADGDGKEALVELTQMLAKRAH